MTEQGHIPHSPALSEASPESLSDLLNSDPSETPPGSEKLKRMVQFYRKMYKDFAAAEQAPKVKRGAKAIAGPPIQGDLEF